MKEFLTNELHGLVNFTLETSKIDKKGRRGEKMKKLGGKERKRGDRKRWKII